MYNNFITDGTSKFVASTILGIFAYFGVHLDIIIRSVVAAGSFGTAIMACINFYYSIKEKRQRLKK